MKIVRMYGGFANQLFMYAFYLKLKENANMEVLIHDDVQHDLTLSINDVFELNWPLADDKSIHRIGEVGGNIFDKVRRRLFGYKKSYYEQNDILDETHIFTDAMEDQYIWGYWQSYNYFKGVEDEVRMLYDFEKYIGKLLRSPDHQDVSIGKENRKIAEELRNNHSIGVHIRGGDYRNEMLGQIYGNICTKKYYQAAVQDIRSKDDKARCYIFTNDVIFAKDILSGLEIEYKIINTNNSFEYSMLDIFLMMNCLYLIIANSSFSWWGAFLNERKIDVYCPSKWLNTKEVWGIYLDDWVKVTPEGKVIEKGGL